MIERIDWEDDNLLCKEVKLVAPSFDVLIVFFNFFSDLLGLLFWAFKQLYWQSRSE